MVAVTTNRPRHRTGGSSERQLALVRGVVEVPAVRPPVSRPCELASGAPLGRCGCQRHRRAVVSVPRPAAAGGRASSKLRVPSRTYRRRRLAAVVVVAGLALVAWATIGALGGALTASGRSVSDPGRRAPVAVVEVGEGDTVWSIARRLQPSGDVRPLVDRLARARGGTVLQVGERIVVPASS